MASSQDSYFESLLEIWDIDNTSTNTRALALLAGIPSTKPHNSDEERKSKTISSLTTVRTERHFVDSALHPANRPTVYDNYSSVPAINDGDVNLADSESQGLSALSVCATNSMLKSARCNSENVANSNWCIECGTALIQVSSFEPDLTCRAEREIDHDITCNSNAESPHLSDSKQHTSEDTGSSVEEDVTLETVSDVFPLEPDFCNDLLGHGEFPIQTEYIPLATQCTHLLLNSADTLYETDDDYSCEEKHVKNSNLNTSYSTDTSVLKQSSNRDHLNPQVKKDAFAYVSEKPSVRHWKTSGCYMWRKPSTLPQMKHSPELLSVQSFTSSCNQSGSLQLPRPIPLLDLDMVQPVNEADISSSSRRWILCDKVYYSTATHDQTANLICLPDELLLYIMSFLDQSDRARCMYVCSRFYFITSDQSLWKQIAIKRKDVNDQHLASLAMQYPGVENVTLARCTHQGTPLDLHWFFGKLLRLKKLKCVMCDLGPCTGDTLLLSAALNCPKLCEVEFDWTLITEKALTKSIELIPRLEKMSIRQHGELPVRVFQSLFKHHRQWLKTLNIGRSLAENLFSATDDLPLPQLESFAATFSKMDQGAVKDLRDACPALKHLYISSTFFSVDAAAGLSHMPLCTLHLKLFNDSSLDSASCKHISRMTSLRDLGLDCINDVGLQVLCMGNLSLKTLDLSHSSITSRSLSVIGKSSFKQTLKELKLNCCDDISKSETLLNTVPCEGSNGITLRGKNTKMDDEISKLIRKCPVLRVIEVSGMACSQDLMTHGGFKHSCKIIL